MIIKTEVLKDVCGKIGEAVDTKAVSTLTKSGVSTVLLFKSIL